MAKQIPLELEEEDFVIKVHPHRDKNNKWTGDVTLGIITSDGNPLSDYDFYYMMEFTNLICASVPLMQEDKDFREKLENFVEYEKELIKEKEKEKRKVNRMGNIITVKFSDKVDGSA
ncbi:MAG: hypothetical protein CBD97_00285 [Pelagibacteraceae bacterium TMED237]|nr:MAG: hypothetical protein CBD97_00285 [Pelagibacteraceae bacterium TMED237]|tara:strand:+ start:10253 stop:10603 length:351 start_codon:yes stop_codon:yes gene_type:complete